MNEKQEQSSAYELADELQELDSKLHLINLFKSATMLRQQADRIAAYEARIAELEKFFKPAESMLEYENRELKREIEILEKDLHMIERHYDQLDKDVSSKPVAWMDYLEHSDVYDLNVSGRGIPLYTHPVKQLSDERIEELIWETGDMKDFARAIIKEITG